MALESSRRGLELVLFLLASPYFTKKRLQRQFSLHDDFRQLLKEYQAAPSPIVVLSPHFCLMEANTLVPMLYGGPLPPLGALYRPLDLGSMDRWVKQTRERWGLKLLSRKEGLIKAVDMVRHGGAVVVLFDQNSGDRGALSLFMGRICSTTDLAGVIVEKCHARSCFIWPQRTGFMRATIHGEFLQVPPESEAVLFGFNRWLEDKLRSSEDYCAEWLWLHSRWRHQDKPTRRFRLESKRNLLPAQLTSLGLARPPRNTHFFIRLPNWLGDVVMALPLLRGLRKGRPDAALTLLAPAAFLPLLEKLEVGDRYLAVPETNSAQRKFFRGLREEHPDTYILFTNSLRGDLGAKATEAPQRFGMLRQGKRRPLLTHAWRVPDDLDEDQIHQTRVWEKFFQHFGLKEDLDFSPMAWPSPPPKHSSSSLGFICGTENFPEKRWPVERWRDLIRSILATHPDARIHLFGTARDAAVTAAVADGFDAGNVANLAGKTNLLEFADALRACDVVICNDTGGMHPANVLGCTGHRRLRADQPHPHRPRL